MLISGLFLPTGASKWTDISTATLYSKSDPNEISNLIGCDHITMAPCRNPQVIIYCDDEGLRKPNSTVNILGSQLTYAGLLVGNTGDKCQTFEVLD